MAKAPPAAALAALTAPGNMSSTTSAPSTGVPRHSQQSATQLSAPSQPFGGGSGVRYSSNQRDKRGNTAVVGTPPPAAPTLNHPLARGPTTTTTTLGQGLSTCGRVSDRLPRLAHHKARPRLLWLCCNKGPFTW
jgi:hypothetical protein